MSEKRKLTDHPDYQAAVEKLNRLKTTLGETEQAKEQALSTLTDARKTTPVKEAARRYLESDGQDPAADPDYIARSQEYSALVKKTSMLTEAIAMQQRVISGIQATHSKEICNTIRPEYVKLVKEILGAARNLSRLLEKEKTFRDELTQADVHHIGNLPTLANLHIGLLNDPNSRITHFIKSLAVDGYIDPAEVEVLTCGK